MQLTLDGKHQALSFFAEPKARLTVLPLGAGKKFGLMLNVWFSKEQERDRIWKLIEQANK
jgi:hypothetical protein